MSERSIVTAKLKACPFCGGEATRQDPDPSVNRLAYETGCDNRGCSALPSVTGMSREQADEIWNSRSALASISIPDLDWRERTNGDLAAETDFGWLYIISEIYPGSKEPFVLYTAPMEMTLKRPHASLEDAKQCAQDDFDRRLKPVFEQKTMYRTLEEGEAVQVGDEGLSQDCTFWSRVTDLIVGSTYSSSNFRPIRRPLGQE